MKLRAFGNLSRKDLMQINGFRAIVRMRPNISGPALNCFAAQGPAVIY
jgi:hypothetical protein